MKIKVDSRRCQGTGLCVAVAPDLLVIQADGTAIAIRDEVVADLLEDAEDAEDAVVACPVSAQPHPRRRPVVSTGLQNVIVVGGSVGGYRTAGALRRNGYEGRLQVVSAEPADHYYRPALSKAFLVGADGEEGMVLPLPADLDLEVWSGASATALDVRDHLLRVERDGETVVLGYDGLVVATGLAPRRLGLPELAGVHYVRELAEARQLRDELVAGPRVVIVGGGLIGCEVAATCRGLGLDVTIVEIGDMLLRPVLGETVAELVTDLHRAHGVRILTGRGVTGLEGDGRVESVTLTDGTRLPADVVVVSVGAVPRTGWLEGSGLTLDDGVVCTPDLAALGVPSVVAVGDVARFGLPGGGTRRVEHWENAVRQSAVAARTLLEGPGSPAYAAHTTFWTTQYDLQVHVLGHPSPDDRLSVLEGRLPDHSGVAAYHRDDRVTGIVALNQPQRLRAHRHLLDGAVPTTTPGGVRR